MTTSDQAALGDLICTILHRMYVSSRGTFRGLALQEGVPVESLAAAAIAQTLLENYEIERRGPAGPRPELN